MSIVSAANDHGVPHLFRIPLQGRSPALFVHEYALEPAWAPSGRFLVYSGPDIGTNYPLQVVTADGSSYPLPPLMLSRGARHLTFVAGGRELAFLHGELQHKNLWAVDLQTGVERQLTNVPLDFEIRDYDISPDSRDLANRAFAQLKTGPHHPSLHFKKAGAFWSVRVGLHYRALAVEVQNGVLWF